MAKRYRHKNTEELNIWPSFTDLMSNAFMILTFFLLLALFKSLFLKYTADETKVSLNQTENEVEELQKQIVSLQRQIQNRDREVALRDRTISSLSSQLDAKDALVSNLTNEVDKLKSAPPVVVIENSGEYQFSSGSADLPPALKNYIKTELVDKIEKITNARDIYVVEIIGHTDGQINFSGVSNLDQNLENVALGKEAISQLQPGSNADLGLMRALEVVKQLQEIQKQERLLGLEFRAYSAAQLLLPSGKFANAQRQPDSSRRRIEIRFSPLGEAETIR